MIDYAVALHSANWPTMQALQVCIDRHGWPVKFGGEGHPRWTKPLTKTPGTLGIPVVLRGEPTELEASFVTLGSAQPVPYDVNERLASIGATHVRFEQGDRVLTLTFGANPKEYQAGFYVMAALIKCFGGYGFHGRSHGTSSYADSLIAEAASLETEGPRQIPIEDTKRAMQGIREFMRKVTVMKRGGSKQ